MGCCLSRTKVNNKGGDYDSTLDNQYQIVKKNQEKEDLNTIDTNDYMGLLKRQ
jgi:hypothetical protein